jgi:hypothetical protein
VGTSTRIVGAKHALVSVELIVSGSPESAPELAKHVGSFRGAFESCYVCRATSGTTAYQVETCVCGCRVGAAKVDTKP